MITAVFFALVLLLIWKYIKSLKKNEEGAIKNLREIPYPNGLPIIGNTLEIFWNHCDSWKIARKRALEYYPIYRQKIFNRNIVFLLNPEDIEVILGATNSSIKGSYYDPFRKLIGNGMAVSNGKSWYNRRKVLTRSFYFSNLRKYISIFNKEINSLVSRLQKNLSVPVDVSFHVENMAFKMTNATILGIESSLSDNEAKSYIDTIKTVTEMMLLEATKPQLKLMWPLSNHNKQQEISVNKMDTYISKVIQENLESSRSEKRGNVINILLDNPHVFDKKAVRNEIDTFIFAAQDTTSTALSFMMMILANYPEHQETLYEEIKKTLSKNQNPTYSNLTNMNYLDRFVKESLRLYPPFIIMERTLTEEVITKTGYRLPEGTVVLISLLDIHRNPNLFPEPEKFDPERFLLDNVVKRHPFSYIPFSAGSRNCIAQKFAILALKAGICGILQNFKLEPVTLIENIKFSHDAILQVEGGIKVKLTKR
ncbi:hypothetical protein WA026_005844 [Henosepilachna vigintioctopunctata]|uniref:Cytochrome P450 n=1 Tax=Henosepilachna vigintioctopunctata TaxID=420089 RepID=A0AAW1U6P4_9CUCU